MDSPKYYHPIFLLLTTKKGGTFVVCAVWNVCFEECFAIKGGKFKIEALSPPKQKPTHYMKKDLQL